MGDCGFILLVGALAFGRRVAAAIPGLSRGLASGWVAVVVFWSLFCYVMGLLVGGSLR